jgi:undecaprenyl phosphate-alpha-L-ara4N flippase subunit ArnE
MISQAALGVLLVVICALLEGVAQVFLKKTVLRTVRWYLWISLGVVLLLLEKAIYSEALLFLDVGAAYAISSLNLISITFMSRYLLHEKVTRTRWIGVCLIFVGVGLVAART